MAKVTDLEDLLGALRSSEPYIDDGGFSAGVTARVATTGRLPGWLANLIILAFTAVGSALAAWLTPLSSDLTHLVTSVLSAHGTDLLPAIATAAAGTFLLSCAVIWLSQGDAI